MRLSLECRCYGLPSESLVVLAQGLDWRLNPGFSCVVICTVNKGTSQWPAIDLWVLLRYICGMTTKKGPGRPKVSSRLPKSEYLDVRLDAAEKLAFRQAAELSGLPLATWVRDRLRTASRQELIESGKQVPFIQARQA